MMTYFRFLYREINGCFMHFGEVSDSNTKERRTFLYLNGTEKSETLQTEQTLFQFPDHVDLVVLGRSNDATLEAWKGLSEQMETEVLVLADRADGEIPGAGKVIRLSDQETTCQYGETGWSVLIKRYKAEALVVMHGLEMTEKNGAGIEDCVMNVKAVNDHRRCCSQAQPDGYGCALGCVLRQDYDVCKYQDECHRPGSLTGTLLLAGTEDRDTMNEIWEDVQKQPWSVRFQALPKEVQKEEFIMNENWGTQTSDMNDYRTYYIGMESEMVPAFPEQICRRGFYHVPVVLGKEQGLCCSGLVKYLEA